MKALVQRVTAASVSVGDETVGRIGPGLVVLLGVGREDTPADADLLATKVANLRLFPKGDAEFDVSVIDTGGSVLAVSQFTLMADTKKGRRPSFIAAAPPDEARVLYERFVLSLRERGLTVATGMFREYMQVEIHNDGPVTVLVESNRS
ncbi:MAG: D-tyrosyl-tRNA(Tyr) deacylase [Dehalococcoidia bacterium]|nr:D-tyrosyl-tRNA(Tyr) deacylase [Dehalococcoidia bacterium]